MKRRVLPILAVVALAAGCGGDDDDAGGGTGTTAAAGATSAAGTAGGGDATTTEGTAFTLAPGPDGCDHREPPRPADAPTSYDEPPSADLDPAKTYRLELQTSCGTIAIVLDQKLGGPVTDAVAAMARDGFYDGLTFHRVVPQFVLQGGDPDGTGSGGPGFTVTKAPPETYVYKAGDVAMAKRPDEPAGASGSQFFVASSEAGAQGLMQPGSPPLYAVVGHATDAASMTTIGRIDALATEEGLAPREPVYIVKATLAEG